MKLKTLVLMTLFLTFFTLARSQDEAAQFNKAVVLYQQGEYEKSKTIFLDLINEGYVGKTVFYNLANCYAKSSEPAYAALYFEKAKKIDPFDENINHNLNLLNQEINADLIEVPEFFLSKYWNGFVSLFRTNVWTTLYFLFFISSIYFLYLWLLGKQRKIRKRSFFLGILSLLITLITFLAAHSRNQSEYLGQSAIIMHEGQYLKSGPDTKSTDIRALNPGMKIEILDQIGYWYKIELINNENGWIEMTQVELI